MAGLTSKVTSSRFGLGLACLLIVEVSVLILTRGSGFVFQAPSYATPAAIRAVVTPGCTPHLRTAIGSSRPTAAVEWRGLATEPTGIALANSAGTQQLGEVCLTSSEGDGASYWLLFAAVYGGDQLRLWSPSQAIGDVPLDTPAWWGSLDGQARKTTRVSVPADHLETVRITLDLLREGLVDAGCAQVTVVVRDLPAGIPANIQSQLFCLK
jgi:hypothetical protein